MSCPGHHGRPGASSAQVKSVATASAAALLLSLLPRHALAQLEAPTPQAQPAPAATPAAEPSLEADSQAQPSDESATEAPVEAAQQILPAGDDGIAEVVVTGIRGSLGRAMDIKRDNKQLVDAIVAVDIGKFPDNNTVEALQRVTGIQVGGRDSGEANNVTIRGLNDISTTLNGRQVFTATDRSIALADIPASLLGGVNVYKTRSPDMIEGGVAGQIDVRTQRPFDFDGSKLVLSARGIHSEEGDTTDPTVSALLSNRWNTGIGEIGALVNVS
ncbi:TonB-dependent receptor plug domain-containing protein, partial [Hydrocarboniphaga effusa]